jgi:hypothetical protein
MTIFQKYQAEIEKHLEKVFNFLLKSLHEMVPDFNMDKFL